MATADDLPRDWWSTVDVASYLNVSTSTVRTYLVREQMPKPDRSIPGRHFWRPKTIITWHASRPRKGRSAD